MQVIKHVLHQKGNAEWKWFLFASDLHLGEAASNVARIKQDLDRARELNARIIMPGDVIGMILPKDHKRYQPACVASALRNRNDTVNAYVEYARDVLGPYADLIDMVGMGNHEIMAQKYHSVDVTRLLVQSLSEKCRTSKREFRGKHGGLTGYIQYRFKRPGGDSKAYNIWYHHGTGAGAPVTKGLIDANRIKVSWPQADIYVTGHNHFRWVDPDCIFLLNRDGKLERHERRFIKSGNYRQGYQEQDESEAGNIDYTEMGGYNVAPLGGTFVRVRLLHNGTERYFETVAEV